MAPAGAITSEGKGGAKDTVAAIQSSGIVVSDGPAGLGEALLIVIAG